MSRYSLVGYVDNLYYIHDSVDNSVDVLNASLINHAIGLGLEIAGIHPVTGTRDFSITEENFIQLPSQDEELDAETEDIEVASYEDLQQLRSFIENSNEETSDTDEFEDFDDFEDYGDGIDSDEFAGSEDENSSENGEVDEEDEVDEVDEEDGFYEDIEEDDFVDEDEDYEDDYEEEGEEDYSDDDFYDDDDWVDDDFDDATAFQQLTDSLTPEQNHVLAEYYMLRSKLCFDENITSNANINSAFTAVNNMSNSVRTNISPAKLAKINAYRQPGKTWVYAGFIDTVARTGSMSYCTFGHALRYKHIVININKIQLGDILYSYTGNDLTSGSHGTPSDFINLSAIEQGVDSGDIIEFGATCLADFFDVSVEVMAYVKQVQAQSLEEMSELQRYYVAEKTNPGVLVNAMAEFELFDEIMSFVVMDTVRKITAGKESELIMPKEYVSIYKRFTEVNKAAVKDGKLPLLYPRSLIRVVREYLSGIRAYNSVEFSKKTSKKTHKSYVSVSGLNRVIKTLPYLKSGCIYDFLNIVVGSSVAKTSKHPWRYRFVSINSPKSIENKFTGDIFLSGGDKLVPDVMSNVYTSRLLSWFDNNRSVFLGPTMSVSSNTPRFVCSFSLWLLNMFLHDFCGIYGYKRTSPGDETNDRAIYKLDGGTSKSTESYYTALSNYRYFGSTTPVGMYFDVTKIEYSMEYLEKIFEYDYLEFVAEKHLPMAIRRYEVEKDVRGLMSFSREADGSFKYIYSNDFRREQFDLKEALRNVVKFFGDTSREGEAANFIMSNANDVIRMVSRTYNIGEINVHSLCQEQKEGYKGYRDCNIDILLKYISKVLDDVRFALSVFEGAYYNFLDDYMARHNDKLLNTLSTETAKMQEAVKASEASIDKDIEEKNPNLNGDDSTLYSNNKILTDLRDNGVSAFDRYTPQQLAMFANYLMSTQYADAFRTMNAGITAKILETLHSTNFVRVSDKQLYRIKQVLEALIPRFQQEG